MNRYYLLIRYSWLAIELIIALIEVAGDSPIEGFLMLFCIAALSYYFYIVYKFRRYGTAR